MSSKEDTTVKKRQLSTPKKTRKKRWCIRILVITSPIFENVETAMCAGSEEDIWFDNILAHKNEVDRMITKAYKKDIGMFKLKFPTNYATNIFSAPLAKIGHITVFKEANGKNPVRQAEEFIKNKG